MRHCMSIKKTMRTLPDTVVHLIHVQILHIRRKNAIEDLGSMLAPPGRTVKRVRTYGIEDLLSRIQPPHV